MKDSKRNTQFQNAVKSGAKKTAAGVSSGFRRFVRSLRVWQKAGLVLCLVFWILSAVIGCYCTRVTGRMKDQNFARRWSPDGTSAQISTFLSDAAGASEATATSLYSTFYTTLQSDAIALSDVQIENGARLIDACYCGIGNTEISHGEESVSVTAIGVGGDFFNFHPLDLMDGYYFAEDDSMQDRVLLDDETAWRLFGSPHVVGMQVNISGAPHYVAGVFRRPTGKFYKSAGMGSFLIFLSYDSLCKYTQVGAPSEGDSPIDDDFYGAEARLLPEEIPGPEEKVSAADSGTGINGEAPEIPSTAAWVPQPPFITSLEETDEIETDSGGDLTEEPEEEDFADDGPDDFDSGWPSGSSDYYSDDDGGSGQREEVNRSRMNCYEVVLPNPVSGYALNLVRSGMNQAGISEDQMTVVENSSRFDALRLILMLAQPGVRSMQTAAIRYPYWENVALAWEDVLIPYRLLQMLLRYSPILFLIFLLIWYVTHKSWTVRSVYDTVQGRIYDYQSEKIYGKHSAEGLITDSEDNPAAAERLPDSAETGSAEQGIDSEAESAPPGSAGPGADSPGSPDADDTGAKEAPADSEEPGADSAGESDAEDTGAGETPAVSEEPCLDSAGTPDTEDTGTEEAPAGSDESGADHPAESEKDGNPEARS